MKIKQTQLIFLLTIILLLIISGIIARIFYTQTCVNGTGCIANIVIFTNLILSLIMGGVLGLVYFRQNQKKAKQSIFIAIASSIVLFLILIAFVWMGLSTEGLIDNSNIPKIDLPQIVNNIKKNNSDKKSDIINNFGNCIAADNIVMESYPRQCRTTDGQTFVEDIGNYIEKK